MKFLIFFMLALPTFSFGQVDEVLKRGIKAVSSPDGIWIPECTDPNAAVWCKDLYRTVCSSQKTKTNKHQILNQKIISSTYGKLNKNASQKEIIQAAQHAVKMSDELIFSEGQLTRKDVLDTVKETKTTMTQIISSSKHIDADFKGAMNDRVNSVVLKSGQEYVDSLVDWALKWEPHVPRDTHLKAALEIYMSTCGPTGMEVNAFYEKETLVLCPGLIYSLVDFDPKSKKEIMAALSFTIGHEIGHSIDAVEGPELYYKMKACYEDVTKKKNIFSGETAGEISSDYWGTQVFKQSLKNHKIKWPIAIRVIAMATDGFCSDNTSSKQKPHLDGKVRVNLTISKDPSIRELLSCETPSPANPACGMEGKITK